MKYLNRLAASRNWLAGGQISCADLAAAAAISVLDYLGEIHWEEEPAAKGLVCPGEITAFIPAPVVGQGYGPAAGIALH